MKTKIIPTWATSVVFVPYGIDGRPPMFPVFLLPHEFIAQAPELAAREGRGEWECLAYAVSSRRKVGFLNPYGKDNPCQTLRSRNGGRVRLLCRFSYMHWPIPQFKLETI